MGFAVIEAVLGEPLPASARASRAWWSNRENGTQAAAWLQAGYRVAAVDLTNEQIIFRKKRKQARYNATAASGPFAWNSTTIHALREHMGVSQNALAEELGVRQQTISEWETGAYTPTRASARALARIAEAAGFFQSTIKDEPHEEM